MRIAIDFTATPRNKTGIGRYLLGLLLGLQSVASEHTFFLFVHDDDIDGFPILSDRFTIVPVKSKILRRTWIRILWEQFVLPFRLRKLRIDLLHCPNFTMPYAVRLVNPRIRVVGTFHDMTYFFLPEFHVGWKREFFKFYIRHTARRADKLITISENSRADIPRYCRPQNPDVAVTCMGVDPRFFTSPPASEALLSRLSITSPYILYVGTQEPRKNIPGLIEGFRLLPDSLTSTHKLVICGKKGWLYDEIDGLLSQYPHLRSRVIFTGFVPDDDLPSLIRSARVFAYVSFYEGFGIPVIESMASGVLTVTSRGSSLEEVAGDGALLVDPRTPSSIAAALSFALTPGNESEKTQMISRGIERAGTYTWSRCAEETLAAYRDAADWDAASKGGRR